MVEQQQIITAEPIVEEREKLDLAGVRILVVMPSIPLYGMERKNLQIMREMRERGAGVLFITQERYGDSIRREVEQIGCEWTTASFDKLLNISKNPREMASVLYAWAKSAWQLWRIYKEYRPTHIHITNFTYFLYSWPVVALLRCKVIMCMPTPPDTYLPPFKQQLSNFVWRYGVERVSDVIVCNSQFTLSQLEKIGVNIRIARVIYNTIPQRSVQNASDAPMVDSSKINVVFVGRICADKGVRCLIDAAYQILDERDDVNFYLAGDYSWKNPFAESLIQEVKSKGLESHIYFLGEVEDIPGLVSQCDIHVCPSVCDEAFGLVVLEAKQQKIPSVVFPSGGLPETVEHLVDGYLCAGKSAHDLYEGLSHFLNDQEVRLRDGIAAYQSLSRFSLERNSKEWVSVFNTRLSRI